MKNSERNSPRNEEKTLTTADLQQALGVSSPATANQWADAYNALAASPVRRNARNQRVFDAEQIAQIVAAHQLFASGTVSTRMEAIARIVQMRPPTSHLVPTGGGALTSSPAKSAGMSHPHMPPDSPTINSAIQTQPAAVIQSANWMPSAEKAPQLSHKDTRLAKSNGIFVLFQIRFWVTLTNKILDKILGFGFLVFQAILMTKLSIFIAGKVVKVPVISFEIIFWFSIFVVILMHIIFFVKENSE